MARCKTGIKGFDELVEGGFVEGSSILLEGSPGTGKSIFAMQFLYNGAVLYKEKGLYVSFEQRAEELKRQAKQFGWDFDELESKGMAKIISIPVKDITEKTIIDIIEMCNKEKIRRLVIDSLSTLAVNAPIYVTRPDLSIKDVVSNNVFLSPPIVGDLIVRRFLYNFIDYLKDLKKTTKILIAEAPENSPGIENSLAEFLCDGLIRLNFESMGGEYSRSMIIRKFRETKNDEDLHPVEISKKGIVVHSLEEK